MTTFLKNAAKSGKLQSITPNHSSKLIFTLILVPLCVHVILQLLEFKASNNVLGEFETVHISQPNNNSTGDDSEEEAVLREASFGSINSMITKFTWLELPSINVRASSD